MKLFNRQKSDTTTHVEPASYIPGQQEHPSKIDWKRAVPRIAGLILVLLVLIFGVLWAVGVFSKDKPTAKDKATSSSKDKNNSSDNNQSGSNSQTPSGESNTQAGGAGGQSSTTGTGTATPPTGTQPLTNTGPGDVLAIFAGVSVASGVAYQVILRKRLSTK